METVENPQITDAVVIGGGISGIVTAKCMRDVGFNVVVLERTNDVGGLWTFKEKKYGVMRCTYINVSKPNYSFSDYPFPESLPDYVFHEQMAQYIRDYVKHFNVKDSLKFNIQVNTVTRKGELWEIVAEKVEEDEDGVIRPTGKTTVYHSKFVAVATGHHTKPNRPSFPGLSDYKGKAYHSVDFNDAVSNDMVGKKVVVVGIGNSAVDVAVNAVEAGRCRPVYLSTRSGAWVVSNYLFGYPTDHYACRAFLWLPWRLATMVFEMINSFVLGHPNKWGLNPKMHALQSQPTVSATLIHHIQRKNVKIVKNITNIEGKTVKFEGGESVEADQVVMCTGYTIDLPFLSKDVNSKVFDPESNNIMLYKNVFSPEMDHTMAFIGFAQPSSGGLLTMSEIQARWWAELCKKNVTLPAKEKMKKEIKKDMDYVKTRWFASKRHTIQRDPMLYNDEIASFIGAKPEFMKHPWLAWRLLLGCCGAAQWRLQGPGKWSGAEAEVCKVPVTPFMVVGSLVMIVLLWYLIGTPLSMLLHFLDTMVFSH